MDGFRFWSSVHGRNNSVRAELIPSMGGKNPSMDGILIWPRIGHSPSVQEFSPWTVFPRPWAEEFRPD